MARKSNKTAHVLNLLASGSNTESQEEQAKPEQQKKSPTNISLIDPAVTSDPLSSLIRESLDKEIIENGSESNIPKEKEAQTAKMEDDGFLSDQTEIKETVLPDEPDKQPQEIPFTEQELAPVPENMESVSEPLPDVLPAETKFEEPIETIIKKEEPLEAIVPEQTVPVNKTETTGTLDHSITANIVPEKKAEIPVTVDTPQESASVQQSPTEDTPNTQKYDYQYVNVMDIVVEGRLMEFVKRFGVCTCDRCVKDTKALAMSNLPAKYIVTPATSIPPLLSFYKNKYNIYVITELTKACLAVLDNPRH